MSKTTLVCSKISPAMFPRDEVWVAKPVKGDAAPAYAGFGGYEASLKWATRESEGRLMLMTKIDDATFEVVIY